MGKSRDDTAAESFPAHVKDDLEPKELEQKLQASSSDEVLDPQREKGAETTAGEEPPPPRQLQGLPWILLVIGVFSAQFLFSLDNTIVADVQPRIVEELGEIEKLTWITVAFELGAVSANLLWGKLYNLFNNKVLFLSAIALFEIGSALCGAAPTMDALIVGRAICGLGGNGIYIGTMNIVSALTTIKERPLYLSFSGIAWGVGTLLGPIIGGAFADSSAGWRWGFYINICVGGALAPIYIFILPAHRPCQSLSVWARIKRIDFLGAILFVGGFTAGIMAISFGGALYAWRSSPIIGLFCGSGAIWTLFCIQQATSFLTTDDQRLFPVHLLKSVDMWILFMQTAASIAAMFLIICFIPIFFQFVHTDSALQAGVRLLPLIIVGVFFSVLSGGVMGKYGYYMPWYFAGSALVVVGAALMRTVGPDTPTTYVYGYSIIVAAGVGCYTQASFPVAQAKVPKEDVPAAVAFIGCAQLGGLTLSFSIAYAIFVNTATNSISPLLPGASTAAVQAAIAGVGGDLFKSLSGDVREQVLQAISDSVSNVYDQVLATAAFSLVLAAFMKRERLFLQP